MTSTMPEPVTFTDGLRKLADLLDEHNAAENGDSLRHLVYVMNRDAMIALVRDIGGQWVKDDLGDYFGLELACGGGVSLYVYTARSNVCERRVIGTETVRVPAPDAPLVEVQREVVEWVCPQSVLALSEAER